MPKTRVLRLLAAVAGIGGCMVVAVVLLAIVLDYTHPPPLPDQKPLSAEVLDRDGQLLRVFAAGDGRWRMKAGLADIDPEFIDLLIAYEDKRFWTHHGVDPLAMARAFRQMATSGHIVSGGSTITMQLARLLEPRVSRTLAAKMRQIARALQLERRLTKRQILEWYLTLAPYGGNLEGTRAASLSYFGAEPSSLTLSQAALLVALPQSPEMRRPDRHPIAARQAGLRVLQRAASSGLIDPAEVQRVAGRDVTVRRRALPALAAHMAQRAHQSEPDTRRLQTSLLRDVQANLEVVARDAAERLGERLSVAIVMADSRDGSILGQVGSANFFDGRRFGWIDMTRAQRSPGSTLKPLIYGLAFGEGLVLPETLIADRPIGFSGYRPRNFDLNFQGDVSIRRALQLSLNVPAIQLLQAVGPARLTALLREAGVDYAMPSQDNAGLSIGLGGLGISLLDLVQVYTSLATVDGRSVVLSNGVDLPAGTAPANPLLQNAARWHVGDILRGIAAPAQSLQVDIAYKTGTSYGYRDAWSVGYDGRYVIGVWIGRADNSAVPGLTGLSAAAPVLFEAFGRSGVDLVPFRAAPPGAVRIARSDLPESMRRFERFEDTFQQHAAGESKPHIAYPPDGARIELSRGSGQRFDPLVLKLQGGRPPFRWLANGSPVEQWVRQRNWQWMPDGRGSATLAVIDASGQTANVNIVVD